MMDMIVLVFREGSDATFTSVMGTARAGAASLGVPAPPHPGTHPYMLAAYAGGKRPSKFLPFEDAAAFAQSLKLPNQNAWKVWVKKRRENGCPKDVPSRPDQVYKGCGWQGYVHWLGTRGSDPQRTTFKTFKAALAVARSLGLSTQKEWQTWSRSDARPMDVPSTPNRTYRGRGWQGWEHWLATGVWSATGAGTGAWGGGHVRRAPSMAVRSAIRGQTSTGTPARGVLKYTPAPLNNQRQKRPLAHGPLQPRTLKLPPPSACCSRPLEHRLGGLGAAGDGGSGTPGPGWPLPAEPATGTLHAAADALLQMANLPGPATASPPPPLVHGGSLALAPASLAPCLRYSDGGGAGSRGWGGRGEAADVHVGGVWGPQDAIYSTPDGQRLSGETRGRSDLWPPGQHGEARCVLQCYV